MYEKEVLQKAKDWVKSKFGISEFIHRNMKGEGADIRFKLISGEKVWIVGIECKGTNAEVDHAIGQCVGYYLAPKRENEKVDKLYLAIPKDFHEDNPSILKYLKEVINGLHEHRLPLGLLIFDENGVLEEESILISWIL